MTSIVVIKRLADWDRKLHNYYIYVVDDRIYYSLLNEEGRGDIVLYKYRAIDSIIESYYIRLTDTESCKHKTNAHSFDRPNVSLQEDIDILSSYLSTFSEDAAYDESYVGHLNYINDCIREYILSNI